MVHLKDGVAIEGASHELSEAQRLDVSVGSDLDERAPFTRVLDFLGHVLLVAASGMVSGKGVLEEARRLLGATGDVVAILGTMKSLVAAADLQGVVQQKLERDTDIGGNEEAALLAGAPYSGGSGAGAVSVPPRVIGRPRLKRWESAPGLVGNVQVQGPSHSLVHIQEGIAAGGGRSGGSESSDRIRHLGLLVVVDVCCVSFLVLLGYQLLQFRPRTAEMPEEDRRRWLGIRRWWTSSFASGWG